MRKKVTIYEISKEAGVSTCCVSWVLRNHPRSSEVSEKTRRRILETAEKMGYHRNQLAAAIRIGKVNTIAVILNFEKTRFKEPFIIYHGNKYWIKNFRYFETESKRCQK